MGSDLREQHGPLPDFLCSMYWDGPKGKLIAGPGGRQKATPPILAPLGLLSANLAAGTMRHLWEQVPGITNRAKGEGDVALRTPGT